MPGFRAHCAAATILVLLVSTVGPSAAAAAELIRGITGCATSPSTDCLLAPDPGAPTGALPDIANLAGGPPPYITPTTPGETPTFTSSPTRSGTLSGFSSLTGGTPATSTLSGVTAIPAQPVPTVTTLPTVPPLPDATDLPSSDPSDPGQAGDGNTEGNTEGTTEGNTGGTGGTCADNATPLVDVTGDGTVTAARKLRWGNPTHVENFDTDLGDWGLYNGPGHGGNGLRRPSAATVAGGALTIAGEGNGTSAGMAWDCGSRYGRWEVRIKAPVSDPNYHAVALLWPDAENWPVGGEVDFAEMSDPTRQTTDGFLHYGASNSQEIARVDIDATQWHNWAVDWTPTGITYYVDGTPWFHTGNTAHLPPGPMHLTLQLDLFRQGDGLKPSQMLVDWAAFYPADGTGSPTPAPTPTPAPAPTSATAATPKRTPKTVASTAPTSSAATSSSTTSATPTSQTAPTSSSTSVVSNSPSAEPAADG